MKCPSCNSHVFDVWTDTPVRVDMETRKVISQPHEDSTTIYCASCGWDAENMQLTNEQFCEIRTAAEADSQ